MNILFKKFYKWQNDFCKRDKKYISVLYNKFYNFINDLFIDEYNGIISKE